MKCNKLCSIGVTILLLGAIAATAYLALKAMRAHQLRYSADQARAAGKPIPVTTWQIEAGNINWSVGAECTAYASLVIQQGGNMSEPLSSIDVELGQEVKRGDVLFQADPSRLQVELDNVLASEAEAQQLVKNLEPFLSSVRKDENKTLMRIADVVQVENAAGQARTQLARLTLESKLLKYRRENLSIRATIDGVVTAINAVVGGEPRNFEALAEISRLDPLHTHCVFAQEDYGFIDQNSPATLTFPALPGERFDATFKEFLPTVTAYDPANADANQTDPSLQAVFTVANPDTRLLPGMAALVRLGRTEHGLRVPAIALIGPMENRAQVFVLERAVAHLREIEVGPYADGFVLVESGLEAGQRVVVAGQVHLVDGDLVRELPESDAGVPGLFPTPNP
jgi:RND family efflux transporter MFP subunit